MINKFDDDIHNHKIFCHGNNYNEFLSIQLTFCELNFNVVQVSPSGQPN